MLLAESLRFASTPPNQHAILLGNHNANTSPQYNNNSSFCPRFTFLWIRWPSKHWIQVLDAQGSVAMLDGGRPTPHFLYKQVKSTFGGKNLGRPWLIQVIWNLSYRDVSDQAYCCSFPDPWLVICSPVTVSYCVCERSWLMSICLSSIDSNC